MTLRLLPSAAPHPRLAFDLRWQEAETGPRSVCAAGALRGRQPRSAVRGMVPASHISPRSSYRHVPDHIAV